MAIDSTILTLKIVSELLGLPSDCIKLNADGTPNLTNGTTYTDKGFQLPKGLLQTDNKCVLRVEQPIAKDGCSVETSIDAVNFVNGIYQLIGFANSAASGCVMYDDATSTDSTIKSKLKDLIQSTGSVLYDDPASAKLNNLIGKSNAVIVDNTTTNNVTPVQITAAGGVLYSDGTANSRTIDKVGNLIREAGGVKYKDEIYLHDTSISAKEFLRGYISHSNNSVNRFYDDNLDNYSSYEEMVPEYQFDGKVSDDEELNAMILSLSRLN